MLQHIVLDPLQTLQAFYQTTLPEQRKGSEYAVIQSSMKKNDAVLNQTLLYVTSKRRCGEYVGKQKFLHFFRILFPHKPGGEGAESLSSKVATGKDAANDSP